MHALLETALFLHGIFLLSSRMNVLNALQVFCRSSIISIISHTLYSQCTKTTYMFVQSIEMGELFVLFLHPANILCDDLNVGKHFRQYFDPSYLLFFHSYTNV